MKFFLEEIKLLGKSFFYFSLKKIKRFSSPAFRKNFFLALDERGNSEKLLTLSSAQLFPYKVRDRALQHTERKPCTDRVCVVCAWLSLCLCACVCLCSCACVSLSLCARLSLSMALRVALSMARTAKHAGYREIWPFIFFCGNFLGPFFFFLNFRCTGENILTPKGPFVHGDVDCDVRSAGVCVRTV